MTKISRKLRGLVLLPPCALLFFIGAVTVQAATYYVATTGTDASPGTLSQPFRTITRGIRSLQAGDKLSIRAGTYVERLHSSQGLVWPDGDSWSNPITIAAYPGESVTLRPGPGGSVIALDRPDQASHYIIFDGLILDAINTGAESAVGIMEGAHHIRFQNCEIKNSYQNGVIVGWGPSGMSGDFNEFINCKVHHSGRDGSSQSVIGVNVPGPDTQPGFGRGHGFYIETSHNLVRNCVIHSNGEYGLKFYYGNPSSGRRANNNLIIGSILHANGQNTTRMGHPVGGGILLATGTNNRAINNIVYNGNSIWLHGIDTGYTATDSLIYNNTIYNMGIGIQVTPSSTNAIIKNNIIYMNNNIPTDDNGVGTIWSNNLIQSNPQFVDAAAGNFRLLSTSPAIDRGAPLNEVTKDIAGVSRPQGTTHEIGAYEVGTGSDSAAPSAPRGLIIN